MNKHVKEKKKIKLIKRQLPKQQLLFYNQFPNLWVACECLNIPRMSVKKVYRRVREKLDKDEFQNSLKLIITVLDKGISFYRFEKNSIFESYWNMYKSLGVMFKDNEGNIKLKVV